MCFWWLLKLRFRHDEIRVTNHTFIVWTNPGPIIIPIIDLLCMIFRCVMYGNQHVLELNWQFGILDFCIWILTDVWSHFFYCNCWLTVQLLHRLPCRWERKLYLLHCGGMSCDKIPMSPKSSWSSCNNLVIAFRKISIYGVGLTMFQTRSLAQKISSIIFPSVCFGDSATKPKRSAPMLRKKFATTHAAWSGEANWPTPARLSLVCTAGLPGTWSGDRPHNVATSWGCKCRRRVISSPFILTVLLRGHTTPYNPWSFSLWDEKPLDLHPHWQKVNCEPQLCVAVGMGLNMLSMHDCTPPLTVWKPLSSYNSHSKCFNASPSTLNILGITCMTPGSNARSGIAGMQLGGNDGWLTTAHHLVRNDGHVRWRWITSCTTL